MRKYMMMFICFMSLAVRATAVIPTNGLPIIMRSGSYEVQVSPAQAWTPFNISYGGTKVGLDNGYYGTVIRKSPTIFTGSGHTEGGAELVTNLVIEVDGISQGEPVPGATYSGSTVTLTKLSQLDQSDERFVLEVSPDGIHEAVELTAVGTQSMIGMYAFMHPLFTNTTEWLAEDNSTSYEGECLSDGDWELIEDVRWLALYSPDQQLGIHISYPAVYSGYEKKTGIWDLDKYHKVYFQPFGTESFAPGTTHSWEMDFKCFESSPLNWKEDARALNSSESIPAVVFEADQDNSIHTAGLWDSAADSFEVRGKASETYSRKAYAHFDLSGVLYDPEASATFSITCLDSPTYDGRINITGLDAGFVPGTGELGTDWLGTAIDWANAPGNDVTSPYMFDGPDTTSLASQWMDPGSVTNGLLLEFTIDRIGDFIQADGSVTILMSSYDYANGDILNIASSENGTYAGPTLETIPLETPPAGIFEADQDNSIHTAGLWDSSAGSFEVRGKASATYSRKAYAHFDLSGISYDPEASVTFSITCLESPTYDGRINIAGLDAGFVPGTGELGADWLETVIDWTNAPGNDVTSPYVFDGSDTTSLASQWMDLGAVTNGLLLEFTIDRIGDFIQSDGSVTILMSSYDYAHGDILNIASSENSTYAGPTLTMGIASPPEILSIVSFSDTVMELTVSCYNPVICHLKTAAALTTDTIWNSTGHSTNGITPFLVTNLSYSVVSGTYFVVYVEADANQKFFRIESE